MIIDVTKKGKQFFKTKTLDSEKEAIKWGKRIRYEIDEGLITKESLKNRKLSSAIDRYIEEILPLKPKNSRNVEQHLKWWKKQLGHHQLNEIAPHQIKDCCRKLENEPTHQNKKHAPATVVRYIASLSSVFEAAIKDWNWIEKNPVKLIRKPSVSNARQRYLTEDECESLLASCLESRNPYLYSVVVLALGTGMRRGELLGLRWNDVNLKEKVITLTKTKNGSIRCIPLVDMTFSILKTIHDSETIIDKDHHIFPSLNLERYLDIRTAWLFALKRAGIKDFKFHDLRHSCASFLIAAETPLREVMEILGHKDMRSTLRYTHLTHKKLADSLQKSHEKFITKKSSHHEM
jgi:integrase